jgi:hypothetical protein
MRATIAGMALALLAGAAQAQAFPAARSPADALAEAVRPARGAVPEVKLSLDPRSAESYALRRAGIARTAIDARLSDDDVTGALGFLCGIQPGAGRTGAAAARGVDPTGRFVGAKLSLAFR